MQHSIVFGERIDQLGPDAYRCKRVFTFSKGGVAAGTVLSEGQWEDYRAAASSLYAFGGGTQLLADSSANFNEFAGAFNELQQSMVEDPASGPRCRELTRLINRRLSNYLSSMRLFLDYTERRLKRTYSPESHEVAEFKAVCSGIFDSDFSYRFAWKLRNYAQHFGMPIGTVTSTEKIVPGPREGRACSTTVAFDVEGLLLNGRGRWGPVQKDLEARAPSIDVASVMRDVPKALNSIQDQLVVIEREQLLSSETVVRATLGVDDGSLRSMAVGEYEDHGDRTGITFDDPPAEVIEYLAPRLDRSTGPA